MTDTPRAFTIFNADSDLTVLWWPEDDIHAEEVIQDKLNKGIKFFIVEPLKYEKLVPSEKCIIDPDEYKDYVIRKFVLFTDAQVVKTQRVHMIEERISTDAKLLSQSQSLAIKPIVKA